MRLGCCGLSPVLIALSFLLAMPPSGWAAGAPLRIDAVLSLTGPGVYFGVRSLEGIQMGVEEANADDPAQPVELHTLDDKSSVEFARELAVQACTTDAFVVAGPSLSITSLAAGPEFAKCGLAAIPSTASGDDVPRSATMFQIIYNTGSMGSALAVYLKTVLKGDRAVVLFRRDGHGQPFAEGFARTAAQLDESATLYGFVTDAERDEAIKAAEAAPGHPAIALGMLNPDAVVILTALRRHGNGSVVLTTNTEGADDFADEFAREPEEKRQRGFFTELTWESSIS